MRKLQIIGLSALAAIAIACGAADDDGTAGSGGSNGSGGSGSGSEGNQAAAGIGDPVRDGQFEFVVDEVTCGVSEVGDDLLGAQAQGQFCLVTVSVRNIGDEPRTFSDSNQKAFDADGNELGADSTAGLYANDHADALFTDINPGNDITAVIVFDIPRDGELARLRLHDSPFSGGVEVSLG